MSNQDFYTLHRVDPIKVEEERARLAATAALMEKGTAAADALTWFAEYSKSGPKGVLEVTARVVASATPDAAKAQAYVRTAVKEFEVEILKLAVALAKRDFELAEGVRRGDQ